MTFYVTSKESWILREQSNDEGSRSTEEGPGLPNIDPGLSIKDLFY